MWILNILIFNLCIVFITELLAGFSLGIRTLREIITVILINVITNPSVVITSLFLTFAFYEWRNLGLIFLEIAVVFSEGYMFRCFNIFCGKNPYLCSLILNVISFIVGELIQLLY